MSVRNTVKSIQDIMRQDSGVDGNAQRLSQLCWMFFLKIIDDQDLELELLNPGYKSPIPPNLQWRNWAADPEGITGDELLDFINAALFPMLKDLAVTGKDANRSRVVRGLFEDTNNYMKSGQLLRQTINKISDVDFNNLADRQHFGDIYEQLLDDLQSAGNAGEFYTPRAVTGFMVEAIDPKPGEILLDPACGTGGFLTCSIRHMRDRYVKRVEDEQAMQSALKAVEKKQLPHMLWFLALIVRLLKSGGRAAVVLPDGSLSGEGVKTRLKEHLLEECNLHTIVRLPNSVFKPYASIGTNLLFFEKGTPTREVWFYEHQIPQGQKAYSMTRPIRLEHFQPYQVVGRGTAARQTGK